MPSRLVPMLARLEADLPAGDGWAFEVKWDGMRAIGYCDGAGGLRLETRNLNVVTDGYPELAPPPVERPMVVDGEIVALDRRGVPRFELLQRRMHVTGSRRVAAVAAETPVTFMVFDLVWLDGRSLLDESYETRRELLADLDLEQGAWRMPRSFDDGAALMAQTRRLELEGVVAKRIGSRYQPGRRTGDWLKIKHHIRQETVIGGWLPGAGRRLERIGALLVGVYDGDRFVYAGRVGTGFTNHELDRLSQLLVPLRRDTSPFDGRQPSRGAMFCEPQLVAEIEASEWTSAGTLRHPSYKGLRDDKPPAEVVRETPARSPAILTMRRPTVRRGEHVETKEAPAQKRRGPD